MDICLYLQCPFSKLVFFIINDDRFTRSGAREALELTFKLRNSGYSDVMMITEFSSLQISNELT